MLNIIHSEWFPAAAWVVFVLASWLPVEVYCIVTGRRLISEVVWYLVANYAWQVAAVVMLLAGHFFTQRAGVYDSYRKKKDKT